MKQARWSSCSWSSSHSFWHRGTRVSITASASMAFAARSYAWGHRTRRLSWSAGRKDPPRFASEPRRHFKEGM